MQNSSAYRKGKAALIVAGTTLGAGIFAIPYIAVQAGILPLLFFILVLSAALIYVHSLYWKVVEKHDGEVHILTLAHHYLNPVFAQVAFLAIVLGLSFTMSAYIVLGSTFLEGLFGLPHYLAVLLFWIGVSIPLMFNIRRLMQVEFIVTLMMVGFIFVLVGTTPITLESFPLVDWRYVLLPFGPILFALSGWTSIEPAVDAAKKKKSIRIPGLVFGTLGVALVYLLFSLALGSVGKPVTPDTLSGILHLPVWKISILLLFGLSAIITSYLPMSVEVKNALKDGLKWNTSSAFLFALFLPYLLVLAGFNNFLSSIALVGGVFVAIQYMTLTQIARKALKLEGWRKWLANLVSLFFVLAVVAQAVRFLLPILGY